MTRNELREAIRSHGGKLNTTSRKALRMAVTVKSVKKDTEVRHAGRTYIGDVYTCEGKRGGVIAVVMFTLKSGKPVTQAYRGW